MPEANQESIDPRERELTEKMIRLVAARMRNRDRPNLRGQHAKAHGCVTAQFTVRDDVPEHLRHGVFREPGKTFRAIARFSNSQETVRPDTEGTARGLAIKLLDVDGEPAIPGSKARCQDFLLIDHPTFPFPTPFEYVRLFEIRGIPAIGEKLALAWLLLRHPRIVRIAKEITGKNVSDILSLNYWSGSPYRLGPEHDPRKRTVKYSVRPRESSTKNSSSADRTDPDLLRKNLTSRLKEGPAIFDFYLQTQTDPVAMPVEDLTVEWSETASPPIPVAVLTIDQQDLDSPEGRALADRCESELFSPWNALAEHRPMGGLNRLRKEVYLASLNTRANP